MPRIATIETGVLVEMVLSFVWLQLAILSSLSRRHGTWGLDYTISRRLYVQIYCQDVEQCTALLNWNLEGFRHWLQLMCCTHLILLSEYFRCVLGTPRIPEVLEVVWEFGSSSGTGASSREMEHRGQV